MFFQLINTALVGLGVEAWLGGLSGDLVVRGGNISRCLLVLELDHRLPCLLVRCRPRPFVILEDSAARLQHLLRVSAPLAREPTLNLCPRL